MAKKANAKKGAFKVNLAPIEEKSISQKQKEIIRKLKKSK